MKVGIADFLNDLNHVVVFVHFVSVIVLVGSLFFLRFYIKPLLDGLKAPQQRYEVAIEAIKRFWWFFIASFIASAVSRYVLDIMNPHLSESPIFDIVRNINQLLFTAIALLGVWMYFKYKKIKKFSIEKNYIEAHETLVLLINYIVPLILTVLLFVVYFCIVLGY